MVRGCGLCSRCFWKELRARGAASSQPARARPPPSQDACSDLVTHACSDLVTHVCSDLVTQPGCRNLGPWRPWAGTWMNLSRHSLRFDTPYYMSLVVAGGRSEGGGGVTAPGGSCRGDNAWELGRGGDRDWECTKCPPRGVKHVSFTECACGHQKAIAPLEGGGNHDDKQLRPESKRGPCEA